MIAALPPGWLGISSLVFYAWLLAGRPGLAWLALAQVAVLAPVVVASLRHVAPGAPSGADAAPTPPGLRAIVALAAVAAALAALHVVREYPDGMWIAVDIWNLRAAFLAQTDLPTMLAGATWHRDYPLLLPLGIGEVWAFTGRLRAVPIAIGLLFTASCAWILHAATAREAGRGVAATVLVALLASPWFVVHGAGQQADVPLACFALGAGALLGEHDRRGAPRAALLVWVGVLLGCASWTKNEGLVVALALVGVRALDRRDGFAWLLLGATPFLLALTHHRLTCGEVNDLVAGQGRETLMRLLEPARHVQTLLAAAEQLAPYLALLALLAWGLGARVPALLRGLRAPAVVLAVYFVVYVTTPYDLTWQIESSMDRVLLHVWPLCLLALGAACAAPRGSGAQRARGATLLPRRRVVE